jgi:hypothetical protein
MPVHYPISCFISIGVNRMPPKTDDSLAAWADDLLRRAERINSLENGLNKGPLEKITMHIIRDHIFDEHQISRQIRFRSHLIAT